MTATPCVFCEIITGCAPASFQEAWSDAIAIVPLNPVTAGHVLIIPKVHVEDYVVDPHVSAATMRRAAEFVRAAQIPDSNIITSSGVAATQSVYHLHLHIVPRRVNDGLALPWYSGKRGKS